MAASMAGSSCAKFCAFTSMACAALCGVKGARAHGRRGAGQPEAKRLCCTTRSSSWSLPNKEDGEA